MANAAEEAEPRPEWVKCILREVPYSYCQRYVMAEFHFTSVEHAANTVKGGGRQQPCIACLQKYDVAVNGPGKRLDNSALNLLLEMAKQKLCRGRLVIRRSKRHQQNLLMDLCFRLIRNLAWLISGCCAGEGNTSAHCLGVLKAGEDLLSWWIIAQRADTKSASGFHRASAARS